jgi:hypothetical protein
VPPPAGDPVAGAGIDGSGDVVGIGDDIDGSGDALGEGDDIDGSGDVLGEGDSLLAEPALSGALPCAQRELSGDRSQRIFMI